MKRLIFSIILFMFTFSGFCQKIVVSSFELQQDQIQKEFVKSLNGEKCALILLQFNVPNISIEGNVVRTDQINEAEFHLWITPRTKMLRIKAEDKYPLLIKFNDYGVPVLESGRVYRLSLTVQDHKKTNEVTGPEINDPLVIPKLNYNYDFNFNPEVDKKTKDEVDYVLSNLFNKKIKNAQQIIENGYLKGYYRATKRMVECYLNGWGYKKSPEKALIAAQKLVDQVVLTQCDNIGDFLFNKGYPELAFKSYLKGALGDPTSVCWSKLGYAYENGIGVEKDIQQAIKIYQYSVRKQYCREDEAITGLIRLGGDICSKEAIETQRVNFAGKSANQLWEELKETLEDYRREEGRDYPKAFTLRKILADNFNNPYAAAEVAKAYDGLGYPIKNKELADHYSQVARSIFADRQREKIYSSLSELCGPDTVPFFDYSLARIGDFYYSDGSLTHDPCIRLNPIGIVFSLNTSEDERQNGWTHGWIISIFCALDRYGSNIMNWASGEEYSLGKYFSSVRKAKEDISGWKSSQEMSKQSTYFIAVDAARLHSQVVPLDRCSGWYLPSLGQLNILMENLGESKMSKDNDYRNTSISKNCPFFKAQFGNSIRIWTSSEIEKGSPINLGTSFGNDNYHVYTHSSSYDDRYVPSNVVKTHGCAVYPFMAF